MRVRDPITDPFSRLPLRGFAALLVTLTILATPGPAHATILFGTSDSQNQIVSIDTTTNMVTNFLATPAPDSLVFTPDGGLVITSAGLGTIRRFDPVTNMQVQVASGLNVPADLALEPGGTSVLVSEFGGGRIQRLNLLTNTLSLLATPGGNPEGLIYDNHGRLFANLGVRTTGNNKFIAELNPLTGAIIRQSPNLNSLDGLTFDSFTGKLFASSLNGNGVYEVDPDNLNNITNHFFGQIPGPDGITSDGQGNIFMAARGDSRVYQYNIPSNMLTPRATVPGLDDLAPASGLGAPIPEPGTLTLLALGALSLLGYSWRRKQAA
jgi:sugar lactone lactonase YvrE